MIKKIVIGLLILLMTLSVVIHQRHRILFFIFSSGESPALLTDVEDVVDAQWAGDYYVTIKLDERTFAIGEPRNPERNYSYLIMGADRAILFDAGTGRHDIRPIVKSLTDLPITFMPSHFHFDHVGNEVTFDHVAVVDLPHIRDQSIDGELQLNWQQHIGSIEGIEAPTLIVDEWYKPGDTISLGGRVLQVLYTPGHTDDSVSLLDLDSFALFVGDFMYPGDLYAFLPTSSMQDYVNATKTVLSKSPSGTRILGGHDGAGIGLPVLSLADVSKLQEQLLRIRSGGLDGKGSYPVKYEVNENLKLLAEPRWLQNWSSRYSREEH
jgi:glyoxylase-like metal-dependent hydrolase (beta-lactamase superfamily II)